LKSELDALEEELHFKLPKEIQKAREFGDLRENAEYKAAMERQAIVQARISQVHQRLSEVQSIDISKLPTDRVAYGSSVVLYDLERDEKVDYRLVTSEESDPEKGLISTVSPIGQALMGKEEGDAVKVKTPTGVRNFEISRLTTIHEQKDK
jgi:transcription elongation factor GreA